MRLSSIKTGYLGSSSLKRRLLSGSTWALGGKVGAPAIGPVTNALLARMLSPCTVRRVRSKDRDVDPRESFSLAAAQGLVRSVSFPKPGEPLQRGAGRPNGGIRRMEVVL